MANLTFCRQDVEHSPFAVGNTRRNATLRNVSQSIFLRKEIALLRKVVGESACSLCTAAPSLKKIGKERL